jgi:hypothetical protein
MERAAVPESTPASVGFRDGLGERCHLADPAGNETLEHLCLRNELAAVPSFEFALRERVSRLANFRHPQFGRARGVERLTDRDATLAIVSERTPGVRLSDLIANADQRRLGLDITAALCLIRQLVPAVAALHESARDVAHGAIGPERLVVTPDARLVVVEYVLGAALEQLRFPRERYWSELRVALPHSAGVPRFDQRADVTQIGVVALSLILGRPMRDDEYPARIADVVASTWAVSSSGGFEPLPPGLRGWLGRALQLDARTAFPSAIEARAELDKVLGDSECGASPESLEAFLTRYNGAEQPASTPRPPARPPLTLQPPAHLPAVSVMSPPATTVPAAGGTRVPAAGSARVPAAGGMVMPAAGGVTVAAAPVTPSGGATTPAVSVTPPRSTAAPAAPATLSRGAVVPEVSVMLPRATSVPDVSLLQPRGPAAPASATPPRGTAIGTVPSATPSGGTPMGRVPLPRSVTAPPSGGTPKSRPATSTPPRGTPAFKPALASAPTPARPVPTPFPIVTAPSTMQFQGLSDSLTIKTPPRGIPRTPKPVVFEPPLVAADIGIDDEQDEPSSRNWTKIAAVAAVLMAVVAGGAFAGRRFLVPTPASAVTSGTLVITTNPSGAQAIVDGQSRGETPLTLELHAGAHRVELRGAGGAKTVPVTIAAGMQVAQYIEMPRAVSVSDLGSMKQTVSIESGATESPVVPLPAPAASQSGWIAISAPVEMQLFESDRLLGTSRSDRIVLPAGRHEIDIVSDELGYRVTRTVKVSAGKVASVSVDMPRGTIALNALPWAEVWIDGEKVGDTPIGNFSLAIGTHDIVFRNPDLGEQHHTVIVTLKEVARLSVDLKQK